jgi:hypothetical protein
MDFHIIDPTSYPGWDNLLLSTPRGTFFHSSSWARVLKHSYGYSPCYFASIDTERLVALIPVMEVNSFLTGRRGVSLPFTDYCDSIPDGEVKFQDLLDFIIKYGKKRRWKSLELRGGANLLPDALPSVSYLGHTLNLSRNEEYIFSGFRDSTKRNIKKAIKEAVEVKINNSSVSIKEFYRLNCMTRKNHGLPPQPLHFFKKVFEYIISSKSGLVVLASFGGRYIAGALFFHFGDSAIFKYGASDNRYRHLRANNLVMWEAIRWYVQNDYKSLFFGRTDFDNQGLIQFKSGWGATEQEINYYRYDFKKEAFVSGSSRVTGFHNKIFRNIPISILTKIGALVYKHAG